MINTILCLSDTHGFHRRFRDLPEADVLVHCGDFCMNGTEDEALDFMNWFCDLPHRHKIFIPGNHDVCLFGAKVDGLDANCHFLVHEGITLEGTTFYGVPFFMEGFEDKLVRAIPAGLDVLVSHQPPFGILDEDSVEGIAISYGSEVLSEQVGRVKPRYSLFGHVHAGYGVLRQGGTTYVNAALVRSSGRMNAPVLLKME